MMRTFLISDTHFGHNAMYSFIDASGKRVRDIADNAEDGDAIMVERWNETVRPDDKVYHLGDVAIPRRALKILWQLNGRKVLIRGNHDIYKLKDYAEFFTDIRGSHKLDKFILSHYPVHIDSIAHWATANIHGHIHQNKIDNPRYINVSVENIDYRPIDFEEIRG